MNKLLQLVEQVQDLPTRNALAELAREIEKIKAVRAVSTDVVQLANAINTITGKK